MKSTFDALFISVVTFKASSITYTAAFVAHCFVALISWAPSPHIRPIYSYPSFSFGSSYNKIKCQNGMHIRRAYDVRTKQFNRLCLYVNSNLGTKLKKFLMKMKYFSFKNWTGKCPLQNGPYVLIYALINPVWNYSSTWTILQGWDTCNIVHSNNGLDVHFRRMQFMAIPLLPEMY